MFLRCALTEEAYTLPNYKGPKVANTGDRGSERPRSLRDAGGVPTARRVLVRAAVLKASSTCAEQ